MNENLNHTGELADAKRISGQNKFSTQSDMAKNIEIDGYGEQYLKSLSVKEYKSYLIAKSHLGSSFGLTKSIGFLAWYKISYPTMSKAS